MPLAVDPAAAAWFPISSPAGILATLSGVCAFIFWFERVTNWRLFQYVPSVAFMYLIPLALSNLGLLQPKLTIVDLSYVPAFGYLGPTVALLQNSGLLTTTSPVFDAMDRLMLPMMLVLLLLNVNLRGAVRAMGRGIGVMLIGSLGVIVGACVSFLLVHRWLGPESWKAFAALTGSWTGGTANLNAVSDMFDASGTETGLAVLADSVIYAVWLPVLLASKRFVEPFSRFTRVEADRMSRLDEEAKKVFREPLVATSRDYLYLIAIAMLVTWCADLATAYLPKYDPLLTASTWRILLITTIGLVLSYTPLRNIAGSQELAMAFVFLYLAKTGALAELKQLADQAVPFLLGAVVWVMIHGAFCLLGAWLLRCDLPTAAIASAANIGGVAASSIVATHHRKTLVPAAIIMALIGIAIGNYCGYITAMLCRLMS